MKFNKAEKLLNKINLLFESIQSGDELSSLELDLLKEYIRKFYSKLDSNQLNKNTHKVKRQDQIIKPNLDKAITKVKPVKAEIVEEIIAPPIPKIKKVTPVVIEPAKPKQDEVITESKMEEAIIEIPEKMIEEIIPSFELEIEEEDTASKSVEAQKPVAKLQSKPTVEIAASSPSQETPTEVAQATLKNTPDLKNPYSYDELFEFEEANDLSSRLSTSKIEDIRNSMGLNERVLTINELFNGNAMTFDKVLKKLNSFDNFSQARIYLTDEIIPQFKWDKKDKLKKAKIFIKLIKRRY